LLGRKVVRGEKVVTLFWSYSISCVLDLIMLLQMGLLIVVVKESINFVGRSLVIIVGRGLDAVLVL
jgi:hypothetical protein